MWREAPNNSSWIVDLSPPVTGSFPEFNSCGSLLFFPLGDTDGRVDPSLQFVASGAEVDIPKHGYSLQSLLNRSVE